MRFLTDPRLFNYLLLSLYISSAVRWTFARSWLDVCYWMGAALLTIGVTFR